MIEVYSFFSGLGILDLGFEETGYNLSFVNEYNKNFLEAYEFTRKKSHRSPSFGYHCNDIRDFLDDKVWNNIFTNTTNNIVGFIGGPPCPDFSIGGKNKGIDGNNGILTQIYVDLIIKRKPDFFLLENVKGLYKTQKHRSFYEALKSQLSDNGYKLFDTIENALEYGVPQSRERLFLVGFNKGIFGNCNEFSIGNNRRYNIKNILSKNWVKSSAFSENSSLDMPNNIIKELTVEYWFNKNNVYSHPNSDDIFKIKNIKRYKIVKEGDVSGKSFKRLHRWRYAPTSAYGNNEVHLHPYKERRLSVAEALALQSLPKTFYLPKDISLSAKYKMIGNGVPYLMAKGIAKDIYDFINMHILEKRGVA